MATPVRSTEPTQLAFSLDQLAAASSLSRRTVERAILSGQLPSRRIGGRRVILRADALRWLSRDQPSPSAAAPGTCA